MLRFLNKVGVVRSMGEICSRPTPDEAMQELAVEATDQILREWRTCDSQDDERRAALLKSLGQIAASTALDAGSEEVRDMRENALEALFRGLREGVNDVRVPLELLRDCPDMPEEQRLDIRDRLSRVFGLVKTELG